MRLAGDRLRHDEIDGVSFWSGPAAGAAPRKPTVHLVQGYDEYVVAYTESKHVLFGSTLPPGTSLPNGVLLLDGRVAGHWKRTLTRDTLAVEVLLHRAFTPAESAALDTAAARQAAFLGLAARVVTRLP